MFESQVPRLLIGSRGSKTRSRENRAHSSVFGAQNQETIAPILRIVGWYSRFIEKESEIKLQLLQLLKKTQAWQWSTEQQCAFEKLKIALTKASELARLDFNRELTVQ